MTAYSDPRALLNAAQTLERAGRLAEAESAYTQLLERWPNLADTWFNLALLQRRIGRFDSALSSYQQALNRGIRDPEEVHLNRAVIFSDCLRQGVSAERELLTALTINPRYAPALQNLANLREDYGRRPEAVALYEQLLALQPENHEAFSRYVSLLEIRDAGHPLIERLRRTIADGRIVAADRASLGFALGKTLDACGAYDEAFDAYTAANDQSRSSAAPGFAPYDRRQHENLINALIEAFPAARGRHANIVADSESPHVNAHDAPRPIFIVGMFRSGSTLTEQILAAHPLVESGGEVGFIPALVRSTLAPFPQSMRLWPQSHLDALAKQYRDHLSKIHPSSIYVTDKRPDNFLYVGLIKRMFPDARIVHTSRNALDNCLSVFFLHLDHSMSYALQLLDIVHYYAQQRRLMQHWKQLYGRDILEFNYEALVAEPQVGIAGLLSFCGLDWDENCLSFHNVNSAVRTASVWQVRQPLYRQSSGRWRNYAGHLDNVRAFLRELCPDLTDI